MSEPARVYFTSMRTKKGQSIPDKLKRLVREAGLEKLDLDGKFVAIKTHFGELGNVSYLKPAYARALAEEVKRLGGRPFITDCNTLYIGMRANALDHLQCAEMNGFNSVSCGAPIVIADGIRGGDEVEVPVPGSDSPDVETVLDKAFIGRAIADADVLITLTHSKGCMASGFAATLKNLSMGCASRAGKAFQHSQGILFVNPDTCIGCGKCRANCGQAAIDMVDKHAVVNENCLGCGHCIAYCPTGAIRPLKRNGGRDLQLRMAEYASAVVASKPQQCFFVCVAIDITPGCDCFKDNDAPVVPNVGMFASTDPVAIDQAVADAICAQPINAGTALPDAHAAFEGETDHWNALHPHAEWKLQIEHAEELGTGTRNYELIEMS